MTQEERAEMALIGARLKEPREQMGVTQDEAATGIGVAASTLSNWEAGRNMPDLLKFKRLLALYGTSGHRILFGGHRIEFSAEDRVQLAQALLQCSPGLQAKMEMLLTLATNCGANLMRA